MKFEIKNRWDGEMIFSIEADNWRIAIEAAIGANADLSSANLRYADLSSANLSYANLSYADLSSANLRYADLSSANLSYANLSYANLSYAKLSYADLRSADLSSANLSSADLRYANLRSANIDDSTEIEPGLTWKQYQDEVVPALLTAGGKALADVVKEAWECHDWQNCPMAVAFSVHDLEEIPPLYRARAHQFIEFFDAKMLKKPEVMEVAK